MAAARAAAVRTMHQAISAHIRFAPLTATGFTGLRNTAAVDARAPRPVLQRHIGARCVVRLEHLPHDHKEIKQPPFLERRANGRLTISFAKPAIVDVRMGDTAVARSGMGVDGFDGIRREVAQLRPVESNLKPTQKHAFQRDRIGHDPQPLLLQVEACFAELVFQCRQVFDE